MAPGNQRSSPTTSREPSQTATTPAQAPSTAFPAGPSAAVVAPVAMESPAAAPTAPTQAGQPTPSALREQCTQSKRGRSVRQQVQAALMEISRAEANRPAGRYRRQRRQHVMEGSFADAVNNHGAKKARWRGLWRQKIQSWLIAAGQNLRILLRHQVTGPVRAVAAALAEAADGGRILRGVGRIVCFRGFLGGGWLTVAGLNPKQPLGL